MSIALEKYSTIAAMTVAHPSQGTINAYSQSFAERFKGVHRRLGALAKDAALLCYLWLGTSRGDVMTVFKKIALHDYWPSYRKRMPAVRHAYCFAHLARECVGLAEKGAAWAAEMAALLYEMIRGNQRARQYATPPHSKAC